MASRKGGAHSAPKKNKGFSLPFGSHGSESHRAPKRVEEDCEDYTEELPEEDYAEEEEYAAPRRGDRRSAAPVYEEPYEAEDTYAEPEEDYAEEPYDESDDAYADSDDSYAAAEEYDEYYDDESYDEDDEFSEEFPPLFGVEPPATRRERMQEKGFWRWAAAGLVLVLIICAIPMYSIYLQNVGYLTFASVRGTMLLSMLIGAALYAIAVLIFARPAACAILMSVLMYGALNFSSLKSFTEKILGDGVSSLVSLLLLIILLAGFWFLLRKLRRGTAVLNVFTLMLAVIMVLFVSVNTLRELPDMRRAAEKARNKAAAAEAAAQTVSVEPTEAPAEDPADLTAVQEEMENKKEELMSLDLSYGTPNLYFFIFDEFGNFSEIEKYYGYDTSEFQQYLTDSHVNFSLTSHSTSRHTKESISTMLNVLKPEYQTYDYYDFGKDNLVRQAIEKHGYRLFRLNEVNKVFCNVDNLFTSLKQGSVTARTEDGLTTEDIAYENSILSLLLERQENADHNVGDDLLTTEEIVATEGYASQAQVYKYLINSILSYFDYFEDPDNLIPNAGLGFLTYATPTHVPLLFQANGDIYVDRDQQRNWKDPEVYLGTYKFTLAHIRRILDNIIVNDPDSIIIILSDHGVRYHHDDCTLQMEFEITEEDATNNTCLIYYRGIDLNIEGISTTDTIRLLLNLLGEDVEMEGTTMQDIIPETFIPSYGENTPQWALDLYEARGIDISTLVTADTSAEEESAEEAAEESAEADTETEDTDDTAEASSEVDQTEQAVETPAA